MRFRAFSYVARGYALALLIGVCLALGGVGEVSVLLAVWFGGAVLTLGLAAVVPDQDQRVVRVPVQARRHQRHGMARE